MSRSGGGRGGVRVQGRDGGVNEFVSEQAYKVSSLGEVLGHIPPQDVVESWVQIDVVFLNVIKKFLCAKNLGDPHKL